MPKDLPLFAQHEQDAAQIQDQGFTDVRLLTRSTQLSDVTIIKTPGQHGSDEALAAIPEILGEVCGLVFQHPDEKALYIAGDTVWNDYVETNLDTYKPDVAVLNAGDAQVPGLGSIIMDTGSGLYGTAHGSSGYRRLSDGLLQPTTSSCLQRWGIARGS